MIPFEKSKAERLKQRDPRLDSPSVKQGMKCRPSIAELEAFKQARLVCEAERIEALRVAKELADAELKKEIDAP